MNLFKIENCERKRVFTILGIKFSKKKDENTIKKEKIKRQIFNALGYKPDLDNPQTLTEKACYLKLKDDNPLKTILADKYASRNWVKDRIGEKYLIPLLGVYDKFDDINFDNLPQKFIMKANHGSGMNLLCMNKDIFDKASAKEKFEKWMATDYGLLAEEYHYSAIPRKIVIEKHIESQNNWLPDYKFFCFNGEPKFIDYHERFDKEDFMAVYDVNWINQNCYLSYYSKLEQNIPKPDNLEEMLSIARKLSQGFDFVRVDLYSVNNKIYFGEMTMTPYCCLYKFADNHTDKEWGKLLNLSF